MADSWNCWSGDGLCRWALHWLIWALRARDVRYINEYEQLEAPRWTAVKCY